MSWGTTVDFQLDQREKEGIWILDLRGHLIIGNSEAIPRTAIVARAEARVVNVIFNFAGVTESDGDQLGALAFCHAWIVRSGGVLKLLSLPLHLCLMVLTKLDTVFEVFTDVQDAVNSFFSDRAVRHYDILEWVQEQGKRQAPDLPESMARSRAGSFPLLSAHKFASRLSPAGRRIGVQHLRRSPGLLASRQVPEQVRTVPAALSNKPRFPKRHPADRQDSGALFLHSVALATSAIS
jgi:anti-sigma B factor antagonist